MLLEPAGESFEIVQILALPGATAGFDQASALSVSSDGRFVFAGIRGSSRIASIALDADAARPVGWAPSGGEWPRHHVVDNGFVHVANQLSNSVATLRIGPDGTLMPHGEPVAVIDWETATIGDPYWDNPDNSSLAHASGYRVACQSLFSAARQFGTTGPEAVSRVSGISPCDRCALPVSGYCWDWQRDASMGSTQMRQRTGSI